MKLACPETIGHSKQKLHSDSFCRKSSDGPLSRIYFPIKTQPLCPKFSPPPRATWKKISSSNRCNWPSSVTGHLDDLGMSAVRVL